MSGSYTFRRTGRRPAVLFGLAATAGLLLVAWHNDAPWPVWLIWGAVAAVLLRTAWSNAVHGCRIADGVWSWQQPHARTTRVALADIAEVTLTAWSDGPDDCRIRLRDGRTIDVPSLCLPDGGTLAGTLARFGVPVTRA